MGVNAGSCLVAANQAGNNNYDAAPQVTQVLTVSSTTQTIALTSGWNLIGNSYNVSIDIASTFGDTTKVVSVWKWIRDSAVPANDSKWGYFSPNDGAGIADHGAAYAASKGFLPLSFVGAGEGFWVNAKVPFTISLPSGSAVRAIDLRSLPTGWNLVSIASLSTPSQFNLDLSIAQPTPGVVPLSVTSLWIWGTALNNWYFHAPALEAQGGTALLDYIVGRGYLDFASTGTTVGPGLGVWINKP